MTSLWWMLLNSQEIYCSDKNALLWWTMVTLMEAHASHEIPDENILFGENLWWYLKVFNWIKICNFDENLFFHLNENWFTVVYTWESLKRLEKVIGSLLWNFLAELLLFWVGVGEINNIDHLSPVETEIGTELGNKYWFRKIVIRLPHSRNIFLNFLNILKKSHPTNRQT